MAVDEALRLRADAELERSATARVVRAGFVRIGLGAPEPATDAALELLQDGGGTELELVRAAIAVGGEPAALPLQALLRRLRLGGWLERTLRVDGAPVATLRPLGHRRPPPAPPLEDAVPVGLSRFALLRADGGEVVLESPRAAAQVVLHDPATAALVAALARPEAPESVDAPRALLQLLADARVLVTGDEESSPPLSLWTFHELLFHARSRFGRHVGGFGGTYRLGRDTDAPPAVKPVEGPTLALPVPDLEARRRLDPPLAETMETRRSLRRHDDEHPIDAEQLGELLYRCARVRRTFSDGKQELSSRPYPAGGSIYELELYPLVRLCAGVEPGLYRYDPAGHALERVADPGPPTQTLLEFARITAVLDEPPQVVLLLASRFGRVAWKYEAMAYALTLKHVGALQQSLYLAATALGLAPCALGAGDSDAFAEAAGLDGLAEATVGEFVVGSRRAEDA